MIFTNFSDEEFSGKWNKRPYKAIRPGGSVYLPFYLAENFAKHLVDRELNKMVAKYRAEHPELTEAKVIEQRELAILNNLNLRQELMDKCVAPTENTDIGIVTPREVATRDVVLKTNMRSQELMDKGLVKEDQFKYNKPKTEVEFEEADPTDSNENPVS